MMQHDHKVFTDGWNCIFRDGNSLCLEKAPMSVHPVQQLVLKFEIVIMGTVNSLWCPFTSSICRNEVIEEIEI